MKIAVDLDGVMLDFDAQLNKSIYAEFGVRVDTPTEWEQPLRASLKPMFQRHGYKDCWDWLRQRPHIWALAQPIPGALAGVHALRYKHGFQVECLTKKPEWAEYNVWKWLGRYRPDFNQVTIVGNDQNKSEASDATILIDDHIGNCMEWAVLGSFRRAVLFPQPWNASERPKFGVYRAYDWNEAVAMVKMWGRR